MSSEVNNVVNSEKLEDPTAANSATENVCIEKGEERADEKANAQAKSDEDKSSDGENKKEANAAVSATKSESNTKYIVHKTDFEKDMVYLYQFSRTPLLPSLSPYCLKVETWLRLTGVKYENVDHKMRFRSKKGQLPFIELNGEEIPDSTIIIKELSARYGKDIDNWLTSEQRNISYAMIAMLENHLIWVIFYWRAKYPDNVLKGYKVNLQHVLGLRVPNAILNFFFKITFGRKGSKKLKAHGIGVHSQEEIDEFGKNDLNVLREMLDNKPFFFGEEPATLDVVAFAVLSQLYFLSKDVPYSLRDYLVEKCPNLVEHITRMKEKCFPDWDELCTKLEQNAQTPKNPVENKEGKESSAEKPNDVEKESGNSDAAKDNSKQEKENVEDNKEKEDNNEK